MVVMWRVVSWYCEQYCYFLMCRNEKCFVWEAWRWWCDLPWCKGEWFRCHHRENHHFARQRWWGEQHCCITSTALAAHVCECVKHQISYRNSKTHTIWEHLWCIRCFLFGSTVLVLNALSVQAVLWAVSMLVCSICSMYCCLYSRIVQLVCEYVCTCVCVCGCVCVGGWVSWCGTHSTYVLLLI